MSLSSAAPARYSPSAEDRAALAKHTANQLFAATPRARYIWSRVEKSLAINQRKPVQPQIEEREQLFEHIDSTLPHLKEAFFLTRPQPAQAAAAVDEGSEESLPKRASE